MTEEHRDAVGADGVRSVRGVRLGTAEPADYSAADTTPVEDASIEELAAMLEDSAAPTRRRAVLALARRNPEPAVIRTLAELARSDPDDQVRQFAVEATGKLDGDPQVALDLLEADADPWVRAEAAVALDRLARDAHETTFETLLEDEAVGVRRNALISLVRIRGDGARDLLLEALDDPSDRVREWAVKLLGGFDDDETVRTALKRVLDDETEIEVVRETAARSLGARGQDVEDLLEDGTGTASADDHMLNHVPDR
ncbi:HEAT repeat domain-containing protein [Halodesulfurarchaeum sp. HSR-GB]|uniref:HEAT repeat domain-containing protein n=1 Tax=Halodesulfurarchaeum sp. HSR-GB TaxID=3074077 RepID=UPI0028674B85|nr:HEAT repeat domain-containing protein [Halodesulfurarchaeum sp. HSR-GB]MDR5656438.1 HEAT repeat domain-containing protein [Halodesulfurarchaeum sp. HSR-GB]